jgi:hypothetical protein
MLVIVVMESVTRLWNWPQAVKDSHDRTSFHPDWAIAEKQWSIPFVAKRTQVIRY